MDNVLKHNTDMSVASLAGGTVRSLVSPLVPLPVRERRL
jgi:hypothetical protein